jgi:cell division protein FtsW
LENQEQNLEGLSKKQYRRLRDKQRHKLAKGPMDLPFLMLLIMLLVIGLIMLFSASYAVAAASPKYKYDAFYFIKKQLPFALIGLGVMYLVSRIDYQLLRGLSVPFLGLCFLLLILVLIPHVGVTHNSATRWLKMGIFVGPEYQPSEIAKMGVILYFSARLSKRKTGLHTFKRKLPRPLEVIRSWMDRVGLWEMVPYGVILLAIAALMLKEPHMSGTILIMVGGASIMFAAGTRWYWYVGVLGVGGGTLAIVMTKTDYMATRLATWRNPWDGDISSGKAYQITQSLMAVGSGGLLGKGLGQSIQKYGYLPEAYNDFIFAIVAEELGYVGCLVIIALFALLVIRGYWLSLHARDRFGSLLVVGITTLLAVQVFLNIAVVTNLIPTTGISLPFFSYGGTALVIQLAEMGVILSVSRQIPAPKEGK